MGLQILDKFGTVGTITWYGFKFGFKRWNIKGALFCALLAGGSAEVIRRKLKQRYPNLAEKDIEAFLQNAAQPADQP